MPLRSTEEAETTDSVFVVTFRHNWPGDPAQFIPHLLTSMRFLEDLFTWDEVYELDQEGWEAWSNDPRCDVVNIRHTRTIPTPEET